MTVGLTEHQLHVCDGYPYTKIPDNLLVLSPREGHNRKMQNRYATRATQSEFRNADALLNTWIPDQDLM